VIELKICGFKIAAFLLDRFDLVMPKGDYTVISVRPARGKQFFWKRLPVVHALNQGQIILDGKDVTTTVPEARGVSIVYQDYALFPHLIVKENIVFGLRVRHTPKPQIDEALVWIAVGLKSSLY